MQVRPQLFNTGFGPPRTPAAAAPTALLTPCAPCSPICCQRPRAAGRARRAPRSSRRPADAVCEGARTDARISAQRSLHWVTCGPPTTANERTTGASASPNYTACPPTSQHLPAASCSSRSAHLFRVGPQIRLPASRPTLIGAAAPLVATGAGFSIHDLLRGHVLVDLRVSWLLLQSVLLIRMAAGAFIHRGPLLGPHGRAGAYCSVVVVACARCK